jgi:hypothetical protein
MASLKAVPANSREKKTPIPPGYLFEKKATAGIAGIRSNPNVRREVITRDVRVYART